MRMCPDSTVDSAERGTADEASTDTANTAAAAAEARALTNVELNAGDTGDVLLPSSSRTTTVRLSTEASVPTTFQRRHQKAPGAPQPGSGRATLTRTPWARAGGSWALSVPSCKLSATAQEQ